MTRLLDTAQTSPRIAAEAFPVTSNPTAHRAGASTHLPGRPAGVPRRLLDPARPGHANYAIRWARSAAELRAAQVLRYEVFNLELGEGLASAAEAGLDSDEFDAVCEHLLVVESVTNTVVGTYRMQTGMSAQRHLGYYSAGEFNLKPFEPVRPKVVELGRACVARAHRHLAVLGLLWQGILEFARAHDARYLVGCSSVNSQDPRVGASLYADLCRRYLVEPQFRTQPVPGRECSLNGLTDDPPAIPKLLRAYLSLGAKICGPPALDADFGTIDFLTLMDIEVLAACTQRFAGTRG